MKPVVAIVGRPNVGKSSLFNRLTRTQAALVDDYAGITRDRHYGQAAWNGREFLVVDTGGFLADNSQELAADIREQIQQALQDADVIVFLLDARTGVSPFDHDLLKLFHAISKPVLFVVNKIDGPEQDLLLYDFFSLGVTTLYPLSCLHRYGLNDVLDALTAAFPSLPNEASQALADAANPPVKIAVVGRPNVGKSSLINRLLGEERMIVSDLPGTTRSAVDSLCEIDGKAYLLIDTAGIRRKSRVDARVEKFSIIKALRSLERCDIALIVLDAEQGITEQDVRVASYAYERGCGCMLLLNKWDLVPKGAHISKKLYDDLREATRFMAFAPMLSISARTGQRLGKILPQVDDIFAQYTLRLTTHRWNNILQEAVARNEPPLHKGKRLKFYYMAQISEKPPTLVLFVNFPEAVHFSYKRYLTNQLRQASGLNHAPLRLIFRQRTGYIDFTGRKKRSVRKK